MKLSTFAILGASVAARVMQVAAGEANANTVALSNGATLSTGILSPLQSSNFSTGGSDTNRTQVPFVGTASVVPGPPDVTYIYVIDTSGSTSGDDDPTDGGCGTILNCMQEFVYKFHQEAVSDGSAFMAAVINFDSYTSVTADLQLVSGMNETEFNEAIFSGVSSGGTSCHDALDVAADLVVDPRNTAGSTVVVFVGDGQCNGYDDTFSEGYALLNTSAIVHSVAVGPSVDCTLSLNDIPANGGRCESVPDPDHLPNFIDKIVGSDLFSVEMNVDGNGYTKVPQDKLSGSILPAEAPAHTTFQVTLDLEVGPHQVCVRAEGDDSHGDNETVVDCKDFFVVVPPKEEEPSNDEPSKDEPSKDPPGGETSSGKPASADEPSEDEPSKDKELSKQDDEDKSPGKIIAATLVGLFVLGMVVILVKKINQGGTKEKTTDPSDYDIEGSNSPGGEAC